MKPGDRRLSISISIAALALALKSGTEIQLLPAGAFRSADGSGRPKESGTWKLDATLAAKVIQRAASRANRFVIDFDHQTLRAEANGQLAPAAGWFKTIEWREGDGLYATDVEWTERAKQMIAAGEYRYLSPVFSYNAAGDVLEVLMAAVTNVPALDGMADLELRAAAHFEFTDKEQNMSNVTKAALAALNLAETATEAEVVAAVAALKAQAPDPAKYVPIAAMTELRDQVAALAAANAQRAVDEVVEKALDEGKLLPAQEKWARDLGKTNIAALNDYIASAVAIPGIGRTQTAGRAPASLPVTGGDIVAAAKSEFEGSAQLRAEFDSLADYTAYRKATAEGRVKVLGQTEH